jgi:subtilisin-like proprotein convertase family protein
VKDAFGNTLGDADGNELAEHVSNFTIESVTRTFANLTAKSLNDNALTTSTLSVAVPGSQVIQDVDVEINIAHINVGDLRVVLRSPQGVAVTLASNNGGTGNDYVGTIFDDSASQAINDGAAPFTGRFRVTTASALQLSAFNGASPNGTWTLEIRDTVKNRIAGTLANWKLHITTEPGQVTSLPTLSINNVTQSEGNSGWTAFTFTVSLSAPSTQMITVDFATSNGTASSGGGGNSDYQAQSGTLTFAPGQTAATITILVRGETKKEGGRDLLCNP